MPQRTGDLEMGTAELRRDYLAALDRYDRASAELRAALDEADEALGVLRAHAKSAEPMMDGLKHIQPDERRSRLSDASHELERCRHTAQRALFRILVADGMTMAEVGRTFGVSRSLVSRFVNEPC
jgi:hypothetical protein